MKDKLICIFFFSFLFVGFALCLFLPKPEFSESERRVLTTFPEVSAESVFSGSFSDGFEKYSTDVFPFRDTFRAIKAFSVNELFLQKDNNDFFYQSGHLSKLEYPLNEKLLAHATGKFAYIFDTYLKGHTENIYLSIIPDKNYFLDTLKLDYKKLCDIVRRDMSYAEYIDIFPLLSLSDYYTTDSHWKQENLLPVADKLLSDMGRGSVGSFSQNSLLAPFYGVYSGQAAVKTAPDTIKYLTNDALSDCIVKKYDSGKAEAAFMYDLSMDGSRDPYEMFLSGSSALITIENPEIKTERQLIVFRDSFASSLVPLLCEQYSKVTLVDIRYIPSEMVGQFISDFDTSDVLFLYSTSMLNSSGAMR